MRSAQRIPFAASPRSSVGIEWELALVDVDSGDLRQVAETVLNAVRDDPATEHPHIRQELLLNTVEIVTSPCKTVRAAGEDLRRSIEELRTVTDPLRVELMCAGTHPFAQWTRQRVTDKERYATLIDRTQWWGRQMLIYGVHVHVGIEERAKVLPIMRAMLTCFGHLQSMSASSPFWGGNETGYASNRALMFQQLPTAGLPFQFRQWEEFERYVADMLHTGVIDDLTEVRWDVRPSPRFGTIEVRICDGVPNLGELLALSALTHCLVEYFSRELDAGRELPTIPPWFAQENKWRAARYGMDAILILNDDGEEGLIVDDTYRLLRLLEPIAEDLGCTQELAGVEALIRVGASYERQRSVAYANAGALDAVVGSLVAEMRAGQPLGGR